MYEPIVYAYAAGVVDSDGCIYSDRRKRKGPTSYQVRTSVSMTTPEVPTWFHSKFGGCLMIKKGKNTPLPVYTWIISSQQALRLLKEIEPYLIGKRDRALAGIRLQDSFKVPRTTKRPADDVLAFRENAWQEMRKLNLTGYARLASLQKEN
jgi:hypothetical protein